MSGHKRNYINHSQWQPNLCLCRVLLLFHCCWLSCFSFMQATKWCTTIWLRNKLFTNISSWVTISLTLTSSTIAMIHNALLSQQESSSNSSSSSSSGSNSNFNGSGAGGEALPEYTRPNREDAQEFFLSTLPRRIVDTTQRTGHRLAKPGEIRDNLGNESYMYPLSVSDDALSWNRLILSNCKGSMCCSFNLRLF